MTPQQLRAKPFSIVKEKELGEKMQSLLRKEFKLIDDPDVAQYINDLGQQILAVAGPQYFNYQFFVIDNKDFNAFAAPSGLIFIHSGLISGMTSENEL
ncbi:MAG: M48 family metalloprotease, partial [Desulfobulbaceae bacterium]|nr:M48 family metalloprotease [Desulfobulbaceae bacterium]